MKWVPGRGFWGHVFSRDEPGSRPVTVHVLLVTAYAALVHVFNELTPQWGDFGIAVAPYEVAGAALSALLVLRTNAGHDRWWEARKLWGGITNQSRNLAIIALASGPDDPRWRREVVGRIVAFGHVARDSLRGKRDPGAIADLIGAGPAARVVQADHMPSAVSLAIAESLRDARDRDVLDRVAYLQAETQRAQLIDHVGGCERILKTPLARAYVVLIRRFIVLFLLVLPWALMSRVHWLSPLFTLLIAYPILALDRIADDLQRPFSTRSINHLPLDEITATIERNLLALLDEPAGDPLPATVPTGP